MTNIAQGRLRPLGDTVIITDMEFGAVTMTSGIYIPNQNGKTTGIKARWGQVYAVGPEQKDVAVGDWIYVEHGRWTRGIELKDDNGDTITIRKVENKSILLVSDHLPTDVYLPV